MRFQKRVESGGGRASRRNPAPLETSGEPERAHRVAWQAALDSIASPAFRLHRYRSVHNRLLQTALEELDGPDPGDRA